MPTTSFLTALTERVIVADGAMGTMLQAQDPSLDDFQGYEGCNEILNVTRPDIVAAVHAAYFDAGVDCVETNTFGANLANLGEYDIPERIRELASAGARIAREVADGYSTPDRPRWVLGSVGPGTKLPTLGHAPFADLRDAYAEQVAGLLEGGVDAVLIETAQDLLQAKAALIGARRAMAASGRSVALIAQVTVETTGTMLLGTEIGAALTALEPLGIDVIGLNCATGPAEMSEHLRHLSRYARVAVSAMPNAGLPVLTADGAHYPLTPTELAAAHDHFTKDYGLALVGGCCGTTPEHLRAVVERVGGREVRPREHTNEAAAASLYQSCPSGRTRRTCPSASGPTPTGPRPSARRCWPRTGRRASRSPVPRSATARTCSTCAWTTSAATGSADMRELAGRLATASTLPIVLDSTEPAVLEAGLEMLGGRAVVNSVNYEDGDGPGSRFAQIVPLIKEHGAAVVALTIDEEGQARTADWKLARRRPPHHRPAVTTTGSPRRTCSSTA